ncbi:ATP-binding cassette domain-containing protein, partial [Candidatus Bathyarchaeota archaeon]|nr:ATP-binding cassette domain-containing protein [Candidatus Bathyarchaeota archaeon]
HELSGGQQQRVALASVLAMEPSIMILDEPTSFLDPVGAEKIFEVINQLNKKLGITIILVEHRLDLAAQYANHVIVMNKGKIALSGSPREIFTSDRARLIGVGIPKSTKLYQHLKQNGLHLKNIPITPKETAKLLREIINGA